MENNGNASKLNPQALFAFLSTHDEYPVSGHRLAQEALEGGQPMELVDFFESLPGSLESESDIVAHAMGPGTPGALDLEGGEPTPPDLSGEEATLDISDIKNN